MTVGTAVLAGHVLEHGLSQVDSAALQHGGQPEQRQEHAGDEVGRHRYGNKVQREVQHRGPSGAGDEVAHALARVLTGK